MLISTFRYDILFPRMFAIFLGSMVIGGWPLRDKPSSRSSRSKNHRLPRVKRSPCRCLPRSR